MKKRKKNKKLVLLLLLVLGISIGYAALASNLKINGNSKVKSATWDIHWENVKINEGSVAADDDHKARITDTARTEVEYSVELTEPGDYYEFTVDAKNDGTIDAEVYSVESKFNDAVISDTNKLPSYVSYSVSYEDGTPIEAGNALDHGQKQTYKVKILYRDDVDASELPQSNVTLDLKFKVEYRQKEKETFNIVKGEKVLIGDQMFYALSNDDNYVRMLAQYNLNTSQLAQDINSTDAVSYANINYWLDENNKVKPKYGTSSTDYYFNYTDNGDVYTYDPLYNTETGDTYSIAYYIESYINKIKDENDFNYISGGLINRNDLKGMNCIVDNDSSIYNCLNAPSWFYSTTYWTGTMAGEPAPWIITNSGNLESRHFFYFKSGVRPVIKLSIDDYKKLTKVD